MNRVAVRLAVRAALFAACGLVLWLALSHIDYHWDWSVTWTYRRLFWRGLAVTMDGYLAKPVEHGELLRVLDHLQAEDERPPGPIVAR